MEKERNKADVYLGDKKAGLLERTDKGYRFTYSRSYLPSKDALKIDPENAFDILLATCGDCIGAVKVIPVDEGYDS
jgi:hypothetical protein